MLSQMSQSSKGMGKVPKYKQKMKESGFQFLLQSMTRDKQNNGSDLFTCKHQLTCSIHLDPLQTAPAHSFSLSQNVSNHQLLKSPKFFIDDVKVLDKSDISITDPNSSNLSKRSNRKPEKGKKQESKSKKGKKNESKMLYTGSKNNLFGQISDIIYKTKQYLSINDQVINNKQNQGSNKMMKKSIIISQELVSLITNYQISLKNQNKNSLINHSTKTTNFTLYGSEILNRSKGEEEYVKIINNLESEKYKLNSLISQHEMTNIKMFIKINQGESEEIEQCKKQLRSLFDKYKRLEGYFTGEKRKYCILIKEKEEIEKECKDLKDSNFELINLVQKYQEMIEKQNKNKLLDISDKKNINQLSYSSQQPQSRTSNYFCFEPNSFTKSFTKSQLRIQSLASESKENYSKISEDSVLGSSVSASVRTNGKNNNKNLLLRGKIGINLTALFQNLTQENLNKIIQDPLKFKQIIKECKKTIQTMQNIITEQNKQLELSIKSLQQFNNIINNKEDIIKNLQLKCNQYRERDLKKAKEKQSERQLDFTKNRGKENKMVQDNYFRPKKQRERAEMQGKSNFSNELLQNADEYRIIATQAACLEQLVKKNKIK